MEQLLVLLLTFAFVGWLSSRWATENYEIRLQQRWLRDYMIPEETPQYSEARPRKAPMIRLYVTLMSVEAVFAILWFFSSSSISYLLWMLLLWCPVFIFQGSSLHNYLTFWQPFEMLDLQRDWTLAHDRVYRVDAEGELMVDDAAGRLEDRIRYEMSSDGELIPIQHERRG